MPSLTAQFELARTGATANSRPMEGLRGFAVLLVFLVHYVTLSAPWITRSSLTALLAGALHTVGNAGVDLFFVLSGYLIYGSLLIRRQPFLPYLRRRAARIYPAFSVVLLIYLGLSLALPAESKLPPQAIEAVRCIAENFLLLSGFTRRAPIVAVSWSLSYEMFYYVTIPLLIATFSLRRRSSRWRSTFFAAALLLTMSCYAMFGAPLRLIMFIAGILLHEALGRWPAPHSAAACAALLAGLGMLLPPLPALLKMGALCGAFFALCLCCFSHPRGWLARAFCYTPLRWLGNMSYSYYLLHGLILKIAFTLLASALPPATTGAIFFWTWLPPLFMLTLFPSAALFIVIERPYSLARREVPVLDGQRAANRPG